MAEVNLDDLKLEDLLFIVGGSIFQGSTADDIELEVLLKLEELLNIKIDERLNGVPVNAVIH
jgi:hypothetical protein|tara:strand:- start:106 stop:291 length:186 start_codon:yes stop_codon:yes gene_type:complete